LERKSSFAVEPEELENLKEMLFPLIIQEMNEVPDEQKMDKIKIATFLESLQFH